MSLICFNSYSIANSKLTYFYVSILRFVKCISKASNQPGHQYTHPELLYTCRDVRFDNTIALIRLTNCLPLTMTVIIGQVTKIFRSIILQVSRSYTLFIFQVKNVVKVKVKTMKSYLGCMKIISKNKLSLVRWRFNL